MSVILYNPHGIEQSKLIEIIESHQGEIDYDEDGETILGVDEKLAAKMIDSGTAAAISRSTEGHFPSAIALRISDAQALEQLLEEA